MAHQEVDVRLGTAAVPVGRLIVERDGRRQTSAFTYHETWLSHPRGFDLAPSLQRQAAPFYGKKDGIFSCLPGAIEDGAPDSWGRKIIEKTSGGDLGDLDYLVGTDDFLRVGALRYFDKPGDKGAPLAMPPEGGNTGVPRLHRMEDVILAARAFEADPEGYVSKRAALVGGDILRQAVGSLGGARPKVNAIDEAGTLWIIKLPKQSDTYGMARAEVMALRLARMVGIDAAEAHVLNDAPHFPMIRVKRFDRTDNSARVPYISAQTFLGGDPDRAGSYEEIAMMMRAHAAQPQAQIHELYRRMAYGILIRNTDDHLRNHGFLRTPAGWRLSPAFDINPEHRPGGWLQTPISEIHGAECSILAALDAAPYFDLTEVEVRTMIRTMAEIITEGWRPLGQQLGMTSVDFSALGAVIENDDLALARDF
jgi:serine/threonine-protein kinase HipA